MKKLILSLFLTSCSFQAETNNLDINYLNIKNLNVEKLLQVRGPSNHQQEHIQPE